MSDAPEPPDRRVAITRSAASGLWLRAGRLLAARALLAVAVLLLAFSFRLPYWQVELETSNRPEGLLLLAYLGHWEGMPQGPDLALLERSQQVAAATALTLLVLAAAFAHHRWSALLALPAVGFPLAVAADLQDWLPAALCILGERELGCPGNPVPLWGRLEIAGQVMATRPGDGLALAAAAAALVLAACLSPTLGAQPPRASSWNRTF